MSEAVVLRSVFYLSTGGEEPSTRSNSTEAVENPYSSLPFISKQGMYGANHLSYTLKIKGLYKYWQELYGSHLEPILVPRCWVCR